MTVFTHIAHDRVITGDRTPGYNLAQYMGKYLWLPMTMMGAMVVLVALALGVAQAVIGADLFKKFDATDKATVETLATRSRRSSVEVGEARKTVSRF